MELEIGVGKVDGNNHTLELRLDQFRDINPGLRELNTTNNRVRKTCLSLFGASSPPCGGVAPLTPSPSEALAPSHRSHRSIGICLNRRPIAASQYEYASLTDQSQPLNMNIRCLTGVPSHGPQGAAKNPRFLRLIGPSRCRVRLVHRENIPTLSASDWSIVRIYPRFLRLIGARLSLLAERRPLGPPSANTCPLGFGQGTPDQARYARRSARGSPGSRCRW
eukprot:9150794-Pyramimonas_sp.AAC.1